MLVARVKFPSSRWFWNSVDAVLFVAVVFLLAGLVSVDEDRRSNRNGGPLFQTPQSSAPPTGEDDLASPPAGVPGGPDTECHIKTRVDAADENQHRINLRARWDAHLKQKSEKPPVGYCLWQCGLNQCCNGGHRTIDHFTLIRDSLEPVSRNGFDGVTLTTQGTIDRMDIFEEQARRWPGPKIVVFAVYNHTANASLHATTQIHRLRVASKGWANTKVRIVMLEHYPGIDSYSRNLEDATMTLYPVNTLRNVVVDEAPTNWVFPLDIDFVPSATLYSSLLADLLPRFDLVNRAVFVVPHFEILHCNRNRRHHRGANDHVYSRLPSQHSELADALLTGEIVPFHVHPKLLIPGFPTPTDTCYGFPRNRSWPQGIGASNYSRWYYESQQGWWGFFPLDRDWIPEAYFEKFWEPFLIARKVGSGRSHVLPRYSESYVGRYRNKVSWIGQLRAERYRFFSILQEFTVHAPHTPVNGSTVDNKVLYRLMHRLDTVNKRTHARQYLTHKHAPSSVYDQGWRCRQPTD